MHITLDRMSRIVVPKAIRDRFAWKRGDDLEVTIEADSIRLRPASTASPLAVHLRLIFLYTTIALSSWLVDTSGKFAPALSRPQQP